jgi:hypothetical protein
LTPTLASRDAFLRLRQVTVTKHTAEKASREKASTVFLQLTLYFAFKASLSERVHARFLLLKASP